ncbi:MAG: hypothetical protein LUE65_08745 [Clostridiales bacterium]|nr:hypothetical protein [Clostridiales bacterium]
MKLKGNTILINLTQPPILSLPEDYMPVRGLVVGHPAVPLEERKIKDRLSVKYFD